MRILAALFLCVLFGGFALPAEACEVGAPYDWKSSLPCSKNAHKLMERMGICLHLGGEEPYDAKRKKFLDDGFRKFRCLKLACDFHAVKKPSDRRSLKAYVKAQYGSVKDFEEAQKYPRSCKKK